MKWSVIGKDGWFGDGIKQLLGYMPEKLLVVHMNEFLGNIKETTSYDQTCKLIADGEDIIFTPCLNFACFDYLSFADHSVGEYHGYQSDPGRNYEVIIIRMDLEIMMDKFIVLSELLQHEVCRAKYPSIQKEIRWSHNIAKMLTAGFFDEAFRLA